MAPHTPHQSFSLHFICRKLEFLNFDIKIIRILKALVRKDLHLSVIEKVLLTSVTMSCGVNLAKVHWSTPALIIKLFPPCWSVCSVEPGDGDASYILLHCSRGQHKLHSMAAGGLALSLTTITISWLLLFPTVWPEDEKLVSLFIMASP